MFVTVAQLLLASASEAERKLEKVSYVRNVYVTQTNFIPSKGDKSTEVLVT